MPEPTPPQDAESDLKQALAALNADLRGLADCDPLWQPDRLLESLSQQLPVVSDALAELMRDQEQEPRCDGAALLRELAEEMRRADPSFVLRLAIPELPLLCTSRTALGEALREILWNCVNVARGGGEVAILGSGEGDGVRFTFDITSGTGGTTDASQLDRVVKAAGGQLRTASFIGERKIVAVEWRSVVPTT